MTTREEGWAAAEEFDWLYGENDQVNHVGIGHENRVRVTLVSHRPDDFPDVVLGVSVEYDIVGEIRAL